MRGGENDKEEEKHTDFSNVKRRVECVTFNTGRTRGERKKEREELFPTIFSSTKQKFHTKLVNLGASGSE